MCGKSEPGAIYGIVTDQKNGQPVAGVEVVLSVSTFETMTNDSGYYTFSDVGQKDYTIYYVCSGYDTVEVEATEMKSEEKYQIDVALIPESSD